MFHKSIVITETKIRVTLLLFTTYKMFFKNKINKIKLLKTKICIDKFNPLSFSCSMDCTYACSTN